MIKKFTLGSFIFFASTWLLGMPLVMFFMAVSNAEQVLLFQNFLPYLNAGIIGFGLAAILFLPCYLLKVFSWPPHILLMVLHLVAFILLSRQFDLESYPVDVRTIYLTMNAAYVSMVAIKWSHQKADRNRL